MTRTLALDIETSIRDGYDVSFDDLDCWEVFAVGVGFRISESTEPETEVLIRRADSAHGERRLLAQLVNWVREREPVDTLLTFNGEEFDLPILANRADALIRSDRPHEQSLSFALYTALDISHRDLLDELKQRQDPDAKWPSYDEALRERGIHADTPTLGSHKVTGADMPAIGRRVLSGDVTQRERAALRRYCESDIRPLFELADHLEREHHALAEADAVTGGSR